MCVLYVVCVWMFLNSLINGDDLIPSIAEQDHTDDSCDDDVMFLTAQSLVLPWRRNPLDGNNAFAVVGQVMHYLFPILLLFEGLDSWAVLRSLPILLNTIKDINISVKIGLYIFFLLKSDAMIVIGNRKFSSSLSWVTHKQTRALFALSHRWRTIAGLESDVI